MKSKLKKIVILLILGLVFPLILNYNFNLSNDFKHRVDKPRTSATYDYIIIDALATTNTTFSGNWSWARAQPWCTTGDGTKDYPYIIENVTIIYPPAIDCLTIRNSRKYFIVRNCTFKDIPVASFAGLRLNNVTNGMIVDNQIYNNFYGIYCLNVNKSQLIDNNCSNNLNYGMYFDESDNNTISGNTANGGGYGIYFYYDCNNNTITGNTANGGGYGIYLNDACEYNTISGNTINNNTDSGIELYYECHNNTISGNTANSNGDRGMYIDESDNNTISENYFNDNNDNGIKLNYGDNNTITRNTAKDNGIAGINLAFSDHNNITDNICSGSIDGVFLEDDCDNNTLLYNILNNNDIGLQLYYSDSNSIIANIANNNDYGLLAEVSNDNSISGNFFKNNTVYGMYIQIDSNNNSISKNFFLNNGNHAIDDGLNNNWNSTMIGNYWDNHTTPDVSPQDGIVDTPYIFISGTAGNIDYLPIAEDGAPTITIHSPIAGSSFENTAPSFNVEVIDAYLFEKWYSIDGGLNNYTFVENGTIDQSAWESLPEGSVTITFYAIDILGNEASEDVIITKYIPSGGDDPTIIIVIVVISVIGGVAVLAGLYIFMKKRGAP